MALIIEISEPQSTRKVHCDSDNSSFKFTKFEADTFIVYAARTELLKGGSDLEFVVVVVVLVVVVEVVAVVVVVVVLCTCSFVVGIYVLHDFHNLLANCF